MILKGVTWGLGVVLLLGFALVGFLIATGGPGDDGLPGDSVSLILSPDETVAASNLNGDYLVSVIERDGVSHRIMIIDMRTKESREIPVEYAPQ